MQQNKMKIKILRDNYGHKQAANIFWCVSLTRITL